MIGELVSDAFSGDGLCEIDTNPKICDNKMFHCILKKGDTFLTKFRDAFKKGGVLSTMLKFANDLLVLPFFCGVTEKCIEECEKEDDASCPDKGDCLECRTGDENPWDPDKWEMCEDFKGTRLPVGIAMDFAQIVLELLADMLKKLREAVEFIKGLIGGAVAKLMPVLGPWMSNMMKAGGAFLDMLAEPKPIQFGDDGDKRQRRALSKTDAGVEFFFEGWFDAIKYTFNKEAVAALRDQVCFEAVAELIKADHNGEKCLAKRDNYCVNTPANVARLMATHMQLIIEPLLDFIKSEIKNWIRDKIMSLLWTLQTVKGTGVTLPACGLIPEVGAAICAVTGEVEGTLAFEATEPVLRKVLKAAVGISVGVALEAPKQDILYLLSGKGSQELSGFYSGIAWSPFPDAKPFPFEGEDFIIGLFKNLLNSVAAAVWPSGYEYKQIQEHLAKCEEDVLNPLYSKYLGCEDSECVAHLCHANEHVKDNKCVPCEKGLFRAGGDPASGADTACAGITCEVNQHVRSNWCVDCAWDKERDAGDNPANEDTVCADVVCSDDEFVKDHACVSCPQGKKRDVRDKSKCVAKPCGTNQRVNAMNQCVDCGTGYYNAGGDDATGSETACWKLDTQWQIKGGRSVNNGGRDFETAVGLTLEQCTARCANGRSGKKTGPASELYNDWVDRDGDGCSWYEANSCSDTYFPTSGPFKNVRASEACTACGGAWPDCSYFSRYQSGDTWYDPDDDDDNSYPDDDDDDSTTSGGRCWWTDQFHYQDLSAYDKNENLYIPTHALASPMCVFRDKGVHDESPTHIPSVDTCDVGGVPTATIPCTVLHARWSGQGNFLVGDKHLNQDDGFGPSFPVILTLSLGAWDVAPSYLHAVDSIRIQSDWFNKRPKLVEVKRWDAAMKAWRSVKEVTLPNVGDGKTCGDGKTSFGGKECKVDVKSCAEVAADLGKAFKAGSYSSRGCYHYTSGNSYRTTVYFGRGGTIEQRTSALSGTKQRLCGGEACEETAPIINHPHSFLTIDGLNIAKAERLQLIVKSSHNGGAFRLNTVDDPPIVVSGRKCKGQAVDTTSYSCADLWNHPQTWKKLTKRGVEDDYHTQYGTLEECKQKCLDGTWFGCLGFSRYRSKSDDANEKCFWVARDADVKDGEDDDEDLYIPTCRLAPCDECEDAGFGKDNCDCGTCGSSSSGTTCDASCIPSWFPAAISPSSTRVMCRRRV